MFPALKKNTLRILKPSEIKEKAEHLLATKLCRCIKKVSAKSKGKSKSEAKAIAICLATNWGNNGVYLARAAISKVAPKVGQATLANAVSSLFKFTGKPISPALAKLLANGGAEYTKLLAAYIISDGELTSSPEDHWLVAPLIKTVVLLADVTTDLGNSVLKALPIGKYIQINPADIEAMNKSATANNQKPTTPPTPPSDKPGDEPSLSTDIRNAVNAAPD